MQTSNRLLYCKGGTPIRNRQGGGMLSGMLSGGGNPLTSLTGAAGDLIGGLITGGKDPIAGGIEKGLDPMEMKEVGSAGKGAGIAGDVIGGVGEVLENIPGPVGMIASVAGPVIKSLFSRKQAGEQQDKVDMLAKANTERTNDAAQATALGAMGTEPVLAQSGGLLYKRPTDRIISFISGGPSYEKGGKAPELAWDYSFDIEFKESTLEKKARPVKVFKRGGKFNDPDKTNVIVAGSRHHEDNGLGDKGVPVIDKSGKKVFEVEKGELVLTKDVTTKLEKFFENYKLLEEDEDKSHKVLSKLGEYFKKEIKDNLHNYEENVV